MPIRSVRAPPTPARASRLPGAHLRRSSYIIVQLCICGRKCSDPAWMMRLEDRLNLPDEPRSLENPRRVPENEDGRTVTPLLLPRKYTASWFRMRAKGIAACEDLRQPTGHVTHFLWFVAIDLVHECKDCLIELFGTLQRSEVTHPL
jgi:hypothetical protein